MATMTATDADYFNNCRPGTQRCIPFATATPFSRFPFLTPPPRAFAGEHEEFDLSYSLLSKQHALAGPAARSRAPYDADGTPLLRAELQDYIRRHHAATDLEGVERRIAAEVDADLASDATSAAGQLEGFPLARSATVAQRAGVALAARYRRWRAWVESQKYLLYVDGEEGMGNKLQPMVSSFALALLQKRVFLRHFSVPHFEDMFTVGPRPAPGVEADPSKPQYLPLLTSWQQFLDRFHRSHARLDPTIGAELTPGLLPMIDGTPLPTSELETARAHALHLLGAKQDPEAATGSWLQRMLAQIGPERPLDQRIKAAQFSAGHLSLLPKGGPLFGAPAGAAAGGGAEGGERALHLLSLDIDMSPADSTQQEADLLCNDLLTDERYTAPWITVGRGYQYFASLFVTNPFTRKRMLSLVNEGNIYGPLARFLLNWNDELRQTAHDLASTHFSRYNIGLQIRMQERLALIAEEVKAVIEVARALAVLHQPYDSEMEVMDAAKRSAQLIGQPENKGPPNVFAMHLPGRETAAEAMATDKAAFATTTTTPAPIDAAAGAVPDAAAADALARRNKPYVTFYLATDNFALRPGLVAQLAPYGHVVHAPSIAYPRNRAVGAYYFGASPEFLEGLKWSVLDSWLLASCDDMITSPSSTFGYVSHGFGSLVPHRVKSNLKNDDYNRPEVLRVLSSEPGSHFWKPLFREVSRWKLCRIEADLPAQAQTEECCPRWSSAAEADHTVSNLMRLWQVQPQTP
jgi:hypothetical protein